MDPDSSLVYPYNNFPLYNFGCKQVKNHSYAVKGLSHQDNLCSSALLGHMDDLYFSWDALYEPEQKAILLGRTGNNKSWSPFSVKGHKG